jgi:hypothetical protein
MTEFKLYEDQDASEAETINAQRLWRIGEITQESMMWVLGYIDLEEDTPFHLMTKAQKRRYFAKQKAERLGGLDLFGTPVRKRRSSRKAKSNRLIKPEFWSGTQVDIAK